MTEIKTPLRLVADYQIPFDYSSIPDITPEDIDPAMHPLAGRTISIVRLFAENEIASKSAYRWDVDVSGIQSEDDFFSAIECGCEWLLPSALRIAADDLIRLHYAGHIVLPENEVEAVQGRLRVEDRIAERVRVAA